MATKYSRRVFPVTPGQVFVISGRTSLNATVFGVYLTSGNGTGENNRGDVPFHMSVRFAGNGEIVRNVHTRSGGWGHEERGENLIAGSSGNPIKRGEHFKIAIYVDTAHYYVTINEKPYCVFPHRRSIKEIQKAEIVADGNDVETLFQVDQLPAQPYKVPRCEV